MAEVPIFCPSCGQGQLIDSIVIEPSEGEISRDDCYSCGHHHCHVTVSAALALRGELSKLRTVSKSKEKLGYKLKNTWNRDDKDNPERPVNLTYRLQPDGKADFQFVAYDTGEIKHIHCKKCDNEWAYQGGESCEIYFAVNLGDTVTVRCLKCDNLFEFPKFGRV